jgi:hypothetical protein
MPSTTWHVSMAALHCATPLIVKYTHANFASLLGPQINFNTFFALKPMHLLVDARPDHVLIMLRLSTLDICWYTKYYHENMNMSYTFTGR